MEETHNISTDTLSFDRIDEILSRDLNLVLSSRARQNINKCRIYLDKKLENSDELIYGINTGFGSLYDRSINKDDLGKLQKNPVM